MGDNIYELRDRVKIRTISKPFCNRCSKPISEGYTYCNDCCGINDLLRINAVGLYLKWHRDIQDSASFCDNYPTNKAIMKLKMDPVQAEVLGECMVYMIESEYRDLKEIESVVPVPAGETERGFNQSALLAKYISDSVGMTFKDILLNKGKKMFSWDKVPGMDSVIFLDFLAQEFDIDWAKNAKIEKIDDGMTIILYAETNSLSLKLNDEKTEVILKIGEDRTNKFIAKWEHGELNIYCKRKPQHLTPHEKKAKNVEDTIECKEHLGGESVLLIDDVSTSGSTLKECASVLRKCGAGEIREFVFAKEVSIKHIFFINQRDKYL